MQGQLAAEQRATRDHRDASKAARHRYQELVAALSGNPQELAKLLTAHTAAGWIPEHLFVASADDAPSPSAPITHTQSQPQARPDLSEPQQSKADAHHQQPRPPKQPEAAKPALTLQQPAGLKQALHARHHTLPKEAPASVPKQTAAPAHDSAPAAAKSKADKALPEDDAAVRELRDEVGRLSTQLNTQHVEAWEAQKKLNKKVESLQARLKVGPWLKCPQIMHLLANALLTGQGRHALLQAHTTSQACSQAGSLACS